ncbi:hypothetical protein K1719_009994 [Acacia pycnantha]|nr:hypothetical protein K1719_009994 [Acacia pycnantha]
MLLQITKYATQKWDIIWFIFRLLRNYRVGVWKTDLGEAELFLLVAASLIVFGVKPIESVVLSGGQSGEL